MSGQKNGRMLSEGASAVQFYTHILNHFSAQNCVKFDLKILCAYMLCLKKWMGKNKGNIYWANICYFDR